MKRLVAVGVALSSLFLLQGTASATNHGVIQDITVDDTVVLTDGMARVTGTITCTEGARWRVGARLNQAGNVSGRSGTDTGDCTGTAQPWSVLVRPNPGDTFTPGPGQVTAAAQTGADRTVLHRAETTEMVNVVGGSNSL